MHGEELLGTKTGIDGDEPGKAAKHETGTDGENKREGHLRDDKTAAERLMAANAASKSALLEGVLEIDARETQRGNETEDHGGKKSSEEREEQNPRVNRDGFAAGQRRVLRNESEEAAQSKMSEEQSRGHAREREKQTFDKELTNDAGARGTQRGTNGQFT